ncbi:MAG: cysteine desulfurase family protein [Pseudomonadota bacterium]
MGGAEAQSERVYLDWNATAPLWPAARDAAVAALAAGGNPSSVHAEGRSARATVEKARRALAEIFGVPADGVTFTSGGTEANMTALSPGVRRPGTEPAERLIVSAVEHAAVRAGGRFSPADITIVGVSADGLIDCDALAHALGEDERPALVSVMAANNETGAVQPLRDVLALCEEHRATLHTDAVQAFGRIAHGDLCAHLISISAHKIGGPLGAGALIRRAGVVVPPLITGGGQERGVRGGTENVAAIAGFAAALGAPAADPSAWQHTRSARDNFEADLFNVVPDARIFSQDAPRLPNTSLISVGSIPAEISLIGLDMEGIAVSSGAACSSGSVASSHVLAAMGVMDDVAGAALRVSVGPEGADVAFERFLRAISKVIVPMKERSISRTGPTYGL